MDQGDEERLERIEKKLDEMSKRSAPMMRMYGFEYKSKKTLWGWPLIHIAQGINPETGAPRVARGIIAMGNIAIGVFALGGLSLGVFAMGGVSLGLFVFGGVAIGLGIGVGGLATGYIALGGMAIGCYAIGGMAIGIHALGGNAHDPELLKSLQHFLPGFPGQGQRNFR